MERLNPATGRPWKYGEIALDGRIFLCYRRKSRINKDGTYSMNWLSPEAWEKRKKSCAEAASKKQKENAEIIKQEKLKRGCECCGYNEFHFALDFDHINPNDKIRDIAKMHTTNKKTLMAEMDKCQVLCAVCHRVKTHDIEAFKLLCERNKKLDD